MLDDLHIQLTIYRNDLLNATVIRYRPDEYFSLEDDPSPDIDSVPLHSDLLQYVNDPTGVVKLSLKIENIASGKAIQIEKQYLNDQTATVTIRSDYENQVLKYRELIYEALLPKQLHLEGELYDLCRFVMTDDSWECIYHGVFLETDEGAETEYRIT